MTSQTDTKFLYELDSHVTYCLLRS